jgi:putative MATE family efflux protein
MTLWYIGVIFVVIPMVGNAAIRATGDTKTPAAIMMVAAGVNIGLDPLLIFGIGIFPGLGLTGAALATVIARAITLIASLWVLMRREKMVLWSRPKFKEVSKSWQQVLYIGLPAAGTNVLVPISAGIITGLVAAYGPEAVAALGVGTRIESLGLGVIMALASVLTPFVGQNWGAGHLDRVRLSIRYAQRFALLWGALLFILLALFGRSVALVFNDDAVVVTTLVDYLRLVPLSYGLLGVLMLANAALNALNRPLQSALLTVLRLFALYIPLAVVASALFGLQGIFGAAAIANGLAGAAAFFWLRSILMGDSLLRQASTGAEVGETQPVVGD